MAAKDEDDLAEAREEFDRAAEREAANREAWLDDYRFARLEEQWPEKLRKDRELDGRPCLTINKLPPIIRQVVNDGRQNKPGIVVHPADSESDPETAEVINGLIRNIEQSSNADIAYDTALEAAVTGGFGYFRINTAYTSDDTFEQDIVIEPVYDPLSVYGDPDSLSADSADWNVAFVVDTLTDDQFEAKYKGADKVDWQGYENLRAPWRDGETVMVAERWKREEVKAQIIALSDGTVLRVKEYEKNKALFDAMGVSVVGQPRDIRSHKVTQTIMSGCEVLDTVEWAGKYIPIIPVYGETIVVEGERHLRSLVRSAKDAQRMFNYWRTTSTELVALAPKAPFIGRKGAFETDAAKWATANTVSHAFMEYDGAEPPQRQPFTGVPAGALQEALNASDDIKMVTGLYDASLGARSNETSGKAIDARKREGDVSTFHYIDNLSRAIRHAGRILIDLIPKVYSTERVVRVIGQDGKPDKAPVNQQFQAQEEGPDGQVREVMKMYDLTAGKYDLTVKAGPSFSSRREEFVSMAVELIRGNPALQQILTPMIVKNFDIPEADEIVEKIEALSGQAPNPMMEQARQVVGQLAEQVKQLQAENEALKQDKALEARKLDIQAYDAQTKRAQALQPKTLPSGAYEAG